MADNVTAVGGQVFRSTDNAGVHSPHSVPELLVGGVPTPLADSVGARLPVKVGESALPTGAATEATLAAIAGAVDGLEALVTTLQGYVDGLETLAGAATPAGTNNIGDVDIASALPAGSNNIGKVTVDQVDSEYEDIAASQTAQVFGAAGAAGDYLSGLLVVPETTSPGVVSLTDGAGSAVVLFAGGTNSVSNLVSFYIPCGWKSVSGAWSVTTGTNVHVRAGGNPT